MSGSNRPAGGKQEKTMSSRLLTMKFMQRAAASASSLTVPASSPLPSTSPPSVNGHPVKRQKLSPSLPQSPVPNASTPHSSYQSDDPSTPLLQESRGLSPQNFAENAAETPWVLNIPISSGTPHTPLPAQEESPPQEAVMGRRTFGDFKKKQATENVARNQDEHGAESLSSGDGEDYEDYANKMRERGLPNGEKGRKRIGFDDERMDKINLKKLKNGGISAAAGMRQQPFDAKKYRKDKRQR